jgi:hypothetical protein
VATVVALTVIPWSPLHAQEDGVAQAAWLAGCWQQRDGSRITDEQWMAPAGGVMVGMSRTVQDGRMRGYELVRIVESNRGLVYHADPSGQAEAEFPATLVTSDTLRFENPQHDFPKTIEYIRLGVDSLIANVSADGDVFQSRMGRTPCGV